MTVTDTNLDQGEYTWIEPDGRIGHKMRQSELGSYVGNCAEQVRRDRVSPEMRRESDAASIGTGVHAGIEWAIHQLFDGETPTSTQVQEVALLEFGRYFHMPNYEAVQHSPEKALRLVEEAVEKWHTQIMPTLRPIGAEIPFRRLVLHEDDKRVIYANGTIDYLDEKLGLIDWKTSSSAYRQAEKQRWSLQASMYTWAAAEMGLVDPQKPWTFTFIVMIHDKPVVQIMPVERSPLHADWLKQQALSMALQVEAELPQWNLSDAHWLCSSKWCSHWAACKGQFVEI